MYSLDYLNQISNELERFEQEGKFTEDSVKLLRKFKQLSRNLKY